MSSLSLQCLSSPSKRDSLDEGYDPDETLKIVVSSDGKKVDIIRDSDEDEYFLEDEVNVGHDDDDDVIIQQQRRVEFDRWEFMKDPAVLAKDTAQIAGKIALGDTAPFGYSAEPKEVRFLDMDPSGSIDKADAEQVLGMASDQVTQDEEQERLRFLEQVEHSNGYDRAEAGRRRSSQKTSNGNGNESIRRQSIINQMSNDDLKRQLEKYASSSLDSDQAVYNELMKRIKSQSSSELDSDALVCKELVERQLLYAQNSDDKLTEQKTSTKAKRAAIKQQSGSLQRMGAVTGSSVESNGYFAESSLPIEVAEDEPRIKYHRHGDQI